jgi:hypothetical protein
MARVQPPIAEHGRVYLKGFSAEIISGMVREKIAAEYGKDYPKR